MFNVKPTIEATNGKTPGKQVAESVNKDSLINYQLISKLNGDIPITGGFKKKKITKKNTKKKNTKKKKILKKNNKN